MPLQPDGPAPYAPPKTMVDIFKAYRNRGLRTPFTLDVLTRAGVPDSLAPRTLQSLKLLDIIDSEGNPSPGFEKASKAPEAEFKPLLADLILGAYSDVFSFADPATESMERVRDAFRTYTPKGQQDRMVTLFLGLLEYLDLDVGAAKTGAKDRPPRTTKARSAAAFKERKLREPQGRFFGTNGIPAGVSHGYQAQDLPPALTSLLMDGLPLNGRSWNKRKRDAFIKTFEALVDFYFPPTAAAELPTTGLTTPFGPPRGASGDDAQDSEGLGVKEPAP